MNLAQLTASLRSPQSTPYGPRSNVEALYATGYWLLSHERVAEAAKVFRVMLHAAPRDERGWLGLGECHERSGQYHIALQLYGAGSVVAESPVRCLLARVRGLRAIDLIAEADEALDQAEKAATARDDADLIDLVQGEREKKS